MPVSYRSLAAAAASVAAAGAVAAVVMASHPSPQHTQRAADVSAAPTPGTPSATPGSYLSRFSSVRTIGSTVPADGDVNPYGIVALRQSAGRLHAGNILVSNYNDKANLQGTGSTIVEISPGGHQTLFARITSAMLPGSASCPGGVGLSTALTVLPGGWVIIGSAPSSNGQAATAKAGCLIVLDSQGRIQETLVGHGIDGPWDSTAISHGHVTYLFVTNAFFGTAAGKGKVVREGTVLRITLRESGSAAPQLTGATTIATRLGEQASSSAFVLGPTGVGLGAHDILYVADTATSTITAIADAEFRHGSAGPGTTVTSGGSLSQPLGLIVAPGGDILTVNGGDGKIVETTPGGQQIATDYLDNSGSPAGAGALFGLSMTPGGEIYYVDDVANTLRLLH